MPPVQINPALQSRLRVNLPPPPRAHCRPTGAPSTLCVNPESQLLLWEFDGATDADQNWDPHLAEGTMLGSWSSVRGQGGLKRKLGSRIGGIKAPRRSSSPLLSVDEQKEIGPLKGDFDWDALLGSALIGELSFSPIMKEEDRKPHVSPAEPPNADIRDMSNLEEETFLATAFLESPWSEEQDQGLGDFLCSSAVNLDQLFDLGASLEPSTRIDTLL